MLSHVENKPPTFEAVYRGMKAKGHTIFEGSNKPYDLNLVGIRSKDIQNETFNDFLCVFYEYQGKWFYSTYNITTDPGTYWRNNPMHVKGTAILCPQQVKGAFKLGTHKDYPALVQNKPFKVWRDNDKDDELDFTVPTQIGKFGINCHRAKASGNNEKVGKWSAGCQVFSSRTQWDMFILLCFKASEYWGDTFTYTLLDETDLLFDKA